MSRIIIEHTHTHTHTHSLSLSIVRILVENSKNDGIHAQQVVRSIVR